MVYCLQMSPGQKFNNNNNLKDIRNKMGCSCSAPKMNEAQMKFHSMSVSKPNFTKFAYKSNNIKILTQLVLSPTFGGSVFQPVGKKGHPRTKKNPLEKEIAELDIDYAYYGGYYYLPDIKESEFSNEYLDVYLLTANIKDNLEAAEKIKLVHDTYIQNKDVVKFSKKLTSNKVSKPGVLPEDDGDKPAMIKGKPVYWKDIKDGITGYARIIKYTNHSLPNEIDINQTEKLNKLINLKPSNLEIESVIEGAFKEGFKDGYCRVMHAHKGSCEVGFF